MLQGRLRDGVHDLLGGGARLRTLGCVNPAYAAWRSEAALALARLGERDQALTLAHEEVELARVWGAPRTLGRALCSAGLVEAGGTGLKRLPAAAAGQTNRDIAQALFVAPKTVQVHLSHAYQKLGVSSRSQLEGALGSAATGEE